jgi:cellulose synthase/poly-beta-1,6-N-acetylglucosamine synthase-like glycosyltransferase
MEPPPRTSSEYLLARRSLPFITMTAAFAAAALLFFRGLLSEPAIRSQPLITTLVIGLAVIFVANPFVRWLLLLRMKRPLAPAGTIAWRAAVVTTFVPESEPIGMIERTLTALVDLRYPHDTWLLDEGDDPDVKRLCARLGVAHFSRKHRPEYQTPGTFAARSKHGNYNAWLADIGFDRYDCLTAFDPDHVPGPDFLDAVLGHFTDPAIGYVQAPQAYYNQGASFVAAAAAEETYDFNSTIQMASYGMGYPIVVGCHNNHRMTALREVGGFAAHDADDLLITILYRSLGWQGVYVPRILARGLTPVDWRGYLNQQRRWARSVLDLKLRPGARLTTAAPWHTRAMNALHGLNYLQPAFFLVVGLVVLLHMLATGVVPAALAGLSPVHGLLLLLAMTACHFYRQQFFLDPPREGGTHWRARILRVAKAPFLLLALVDVMVGQKRSYEITPKVTGAPQPLLARAFTPIAALILAAWIAGAAGSDTYPPACHAAALLGIASCLGLMAAERLPTPPPFDARLLPRGN